MGSKLSARRPCAFARARVCVCVCARACVRACVHACACVCACVLVCLREKVCANVYGAYAKYAHHRR